MEEFFQCCVEAKQEITLAYLEQYRKDNADTYTIDYRGKQFDIEISDEMTKAYVVQAIRIAEECMRLETTGELTSEKIMAFRTDMSEKYEECQKRKVWSIIEGFGPDGIYDNDVLKDVVVCIGELNGCVIGSAAWLLFQRAVLCSAVESVIEVSIGHMTEENMYFTVVWYFLRSCLYIREGWNR